MRLLAAETQAYLVASRPARGASPRFRAAGGEVARQREPRGAKAPRNKTHDAPPRSGLSCPAMKPGTASQTAVYVCMARAAADGRLGVGRFSDPVAIRLLSEDARNKVERFRSG